MTKARQKRADRIARSSEASDQAASGTALAKPTQAVEIADKPFRRTFDLKKGVLTITDTPESEIQREQAFG
jgi:hypothetical protein